MLSGVDNREALVDIERERESYPSNLADLLIL